MSIIYSSNNKPIKYPKLDSHDPSNERYYTLSYFPLIRANSTVYVKGIDVVVPTIDNGCMYECVSSGTSSATTPVLSTVEEGNIEDGDVTWLCKPLTTLLGFGDRITASLWEVDDVNITLSNDNIVDNVITEVKVADVPSTTDVFTLTNTIDILYASGKIEKRQKSIIIPVTEL